MGIVAPFPKDIVVALAEAHHSTAFVETGTFHGDTARWAMEHFEIVQTIERSKELYDELSFPGPWPTKCVHLDLLRGDSRDYLSGISERLRSSHRRAVYWLDGHWCGGHATAGVEDECPLLDELSCLSESKDDIILIDDARMFLCAPPAPHNPAHWPSIQEVLARLPFGVQIVDDVIFSVPRDLQNILVEYARGRSNVFWSAFAELQRGRA